MNRIARAAVLTVAAVTSLGALAACGSNGGGGEDSGAEGKTIALLLPETKTTRYEAFDKPLFEKKVKELCSDCKVNYLNADQDASKQQQQAQSALTDGACSAGSRPGRRQGRCRRGQVRAVVRRPGRRV